ncbi:MAG: bifunctional [glutamine synthetase] adenylyltransferase/[glutamine synthetase]-adenylyl-L-tyrosine phosphorylase, partial [Hyphomicrobium sp.]|nr:bifunctional [glutamine synthetase] adenylyltransferase/[glutamine synthetase]-adenylyl-L-tyrosine phosphorylase [Hyphomicrobium sp.]
MDQIVSPSLAAQIAEWPQSSPAGIGAERFNALKAEAESSCPPLRALLSNPKVENLLKGAFDGSPYLTALANRDLARLVRILGEAPEARFRKATEDLTAGMRAA